MRESLGFAVLQQTSAATCIVRLVISLPFSSFWKTLCGLKLHRTDNIKQHINVYYMNK